MEVKERNKTIIIVAILVAIGLISLFAISGFASSEENFPGTYAALDQKRTTVTELMGVTAASSTAISLLPGDAGTPVAEQLADLSGYFMFILGAICLEKWMVTITGTLAFKILIPVACAILIAATIFAAETWRSVGIKLICFALMMFAIVPASVVVTEKIDNVLGTGAVSVGGKIWTARMTEPDGKAPQGAVLRVQRIEGVKLIVEEKHETEEVNV